MTISKYLIKQKCQSKINFFTKVKLGSSETKITAINIWGTNLITGDEKGVLITYEISEKKKLVEVNRTNLKNKIDKIIIPPNRKIAFVLSGGEVILYNLPSLSYSKSLVKDKNVADMYINTVDPKYDNMLLVITKKKKLKLFDFEYSDGNAALNEQKQKDSVSVEDIPNCGFWSDNDYLIYSNGSKTIWLNIFNGKSIPVEFDRTVQIINLGEKTALSNSEMTLFMKDGGAFQFNPITHGSNGGIDFQGFATFKSHLVSLYKNALHIFKKGEQQYDFVESGMGGHFIAYCKDPITNSWYKYNDAIVSEVTNFQVEVINFAMPYLLFYLKINNN